MSTIKLMTIDRLDRIRESEGFCKGRLEGIDEAIKVLVDAGIVSKEDCDKELERYMREDFEEDDREKAHDSYPKPVWKYDRGPVWNYEFCKIEHGRLKGRSAGIDEGANIVVDARLAKRKECNRVIKQYRQEQELDKKIQEIEWDTQIRLGEERLYVCKEIKNFNIGVIIGATCAANKCNLDNARIAEMLGISVELVEDIVLHKDDEEYLLTLDFPDGFINAGETSQNTLQGKSLEAVLDLCLKMVRVYGTALEDIPYDLRTSEICLAAVQGNGEALKYVPESIITEEICLAAVQGWGGALEYVPKNLMTEEICLVAVREDGWALSHVPADKQTPKICKAAVKKNKRALEYVADVSMLAAD